MRILSCDMGEKNTAWAITENGKLISCGKLDNPINDLTGDNYYKQVIRFKKELRKIIDELDEGVIVAERFQTRMFNAGTQTETVSVMIGLLSSFKRKVYLTTAATWKNDFLRKYKENVAEIILQDKWDEHICDAICIGIWFYQKQTEQESKWFKKFFPIPDSCQTCWWSEHGCGGVDEGICEEFVRLDKGIKCNSCTYKSACTKEIKEVSKAKKNQINRMTSGCVEYKGKKK